MTPYGNQNSIEPADEIAKMRQRIEELEVLEWDHKQDKKKLQRNYDTLSAINSLLRLSLEDIPLNALLDRTLELLLSIHWLAFESIGSIFLVEEGSDVLAMQAQNGITGSLLTECARIPFGKCLCGRAASAKDIVFAGSLDSRHEVVHEDMTPHGHYCVPILYAETILGVINIYVSEGHQRDEKEEEFLTTISNTLAGIIVRKRTEEALRSSEKKLRDVTSSLGEGLFVLDRTGSFVFINPEAERLLGWKEAELLGKAFHDVIQRQKPDGTLLPFEECPAYQAIHSGRKFASEEDRFNRKDGTLFPVAYVSTPVLEKGQVVASITAFRDISVSKKMEEELLKTQKLESIGILAGGVAHDFNNLLTAIWGNISLARMHSGSEETFVYERLQDAEKAARRAKNLTQQLLTFSRGGAPIKKTLFIVKIIQESAAFALSGTNVVCTFDIPDDLWSIEADEGQIGQVIHNLVINAQQSMPEGGEIRVGGENIRIEKASPLPLKPGKYIKLSVEDRGAGIPKENLARIFDPFFTTKATGAGLGLATSYSIVSKHDGHITAESEAGVGTIVTVYLPASRKKILEEEEKIEGLKTGMGKILVMDDEEMIRTVAGMMLSRLGYEVEFAKDGHDAIKFFRIARKSGKPFDILIIDLTIPGGMGGLETIRELLEIDPHVKAIVASGYSDSRVMSDFRKYGFRAALPKPYEIIQLSAVLNAVKERG